MALNAGTRVGVYEITAQIGEGGMGQVYRGRDTTLGREVAIKVLPEAFAADGERVARFEREAKTLASLNHPNIASVYGFERSDGVNGLVMELVEGDDLAQRLTQGAMPFVDVLLVTKQIAAALDCAHEQGIIHRDLKPANIKLRADGTVKVLDFGLAKAIEPAGAMFASVSMSPTITTPAMTQMGMILGTAAYMSPEQAKGLPADRRSDIWSFGVVLYEMLTGQRAFAGEDTADVLASVLQRDIAWALLPSTTPAHVVRLLRRCLERDRRKRLRDIGDALIELEGSSEPSVEPRTAGSRSPRWVWTAVVAAISLAAGASATRLWPSSPAPAEVLRLGVTVPDGWRVPMTAPRVGRANAADSAIAISRDGRQLAFVATKDGRSSLWVRALDGVAPRNIEGTEGASNPFWSPDGSAIAYFAAGKLRKLVLATRESIALCDVDNPRGGAWSSRGVIVFGDVTRPIQRVSENGGIPTPATRVEPGEVSHNRPAFLPDDLHFAYRSVIEGATGNEGPIHVVSLDGGEARKLIDSEIANVQFSSGRMLFVRGGTLLSQPFDADNLKLSGEPTILAEQVQLTGNPNLAQFSASRQGTLVYKTNESAASVNGLGWLELTGGGWRNVGDGGRYAHVELSNDGIRAALAIDEGRGVRRLWLFDLVRATRTRLTTNDAVEAAPAWSPDGRWLAFMEGRGAEDRLSIMVGPGDGSALPRKLLDITSNVRGLGWSADSRSLLVSARQTTTSAGSLDIMRIAIDPPGVMEPVVASRFDEAMPQVSRDGRWLAYRSNESGVEEVYVVPFGRSGPRVVISNGGGTMPRWGRDASELYYAVPESADLSARPGSIVRVRLQQVAGGIQPGVPERVANSPTVVPASAGNNAWSYAVSMDGQRLLAIVPPPGGTAPIMVLKNWESLAR